MLLLLQQNGRRNPWPPKHAIAGWTANWHTVADVPARLFWLMIPLSSAAAWGTRVILSTGPPDRGEGLSWSALVSSLMRFTVTSDFRPIVSAGH